MLTTALGLPPITALVVSTDRELVQTAVRALASVGDRVLSASEASQALGVATTERPALAFVDMTGGPESGLALVHHLLAVRPDLAVYVLAPSARLDLALEGLTLGAAGMLTLPTSGDAILRAHGEVRARTGSLALQARLESEVRLLRQRADAMVRLAKLLPRATTAEIASSAAEALRDLAGAGRVALYGATESGRLTLLGAAGGEGLPASLSVEELEVLARPPGEIVPLVGGARALGMALFDRVDPQRRGPALELVAFSGPLLTPRADASAPREQRPVSAPPLPRFETLERFDTTFAREVEKARRHRRNVSVVVFDAAEPLEAGSGSLEERLAEVVRDCDVLGRDPAHDEALLLLPDTGRLGAQLCRRRIGAGPAGIASYPADGATVDVLLSTARRRRQFARGSAVRALHLGNKGLREIVSALLACPFVDAGVLSPYPLSLAIPSALSLVEHATIDARRAGGTSIVTLAARGIGFSAAVREALRSSPEGAQIIEVDADLGEGPVLDAVVVLSDLGCWACAGVLERDRFSAVHAADPLLADLLARRLLESRVLETPPSSTREP